VWADRVVVVEPAVHGGLPFGRGLEGSGIGPFTNAALYEALGLTVGHGRIRVRFESVIQRASLRSSKIAEAA
jgi:hypothetical protein